MSDSNHNSICLQYRDIDNVRLFRWLFCGHRVILTVRFDFQHGVYYWCSIWAICLKSQNAPFFLKCMGQTDGRITPKLNAPTPSVEGTMIITKISYRNMTENDEKNIISSNVCITVTLCGCSIIMTLQCTTLNHWALQLESHYIWASKGKWALVIKAEENDTSCGTSWILSRARMWSSVSMDGDNPPWRQNIYRQVKLTSDKNKKNSNTTTATVHLHRTNHNATFCPLTNKHIWWQYSLQCWHCRLQGSSYTPQKIAILRSRNFSQIRQLIAK